ncbi:hypothetical protein HYALB_00010056 [Hymenoscyphus albidus]|uniref:Nudix hydrolase domain-containing protein n=1 Tax=Hymenoscyphus albidus TaxID=595503 RepID=A0A9N9Q5I1_9HELO|nr:hypothetical protein HYALB_00010056 [Hymenoscyphus albidus]
MKSYLDLIKECDAFPYPGTPEHNTLISTLWTLTTTSPNHADPIPVGYLLEPLAKKLIEALTATESKNDPSNPPTGTPEFEINTSTRTIKAFTQPTESLRSAAVAKILRTWGDHQTFSVLSGWRNELYPIYGPNNELLFTMERSASPLFGINTYGVHMTCYTPISDHEKTTSGSAFDFKLWIPRRSRTKQTYGGMLDNTVAGGISSGENPFESIIREADEEASLPSELVRANIQPKRTVSYIHVRTAAAGGETGLIMPEIQYIYDLELPNDFIPKIKDGEVEAFYCWTVEETIGHLVRGAFKPNCALCLVDFFMRRGVLTRVEEGEGQWEVMERGCHRILPFAVWAASGESES